MAERVETLEGLARIVVHDLLTRNPSGAVTLSGQRDPDNPDKAYVLTFSYTPRSVFCIEQITMDQSDKDRIEDIVAARKNILVNSIEQYGLNAGADKTGVWARRYGMQYYPDHAVEIINPVLKQAKKPLLSAAEACRTRFGEQRSGPVFGPEDVFVLGRERGLSDDQILEGFHKYYAK